MYCHILAQKHSSYTCFHRKLTLFFYLFKNYFSLLNTITVDHKITVHVISLSQPEFSTLLLVLFFKAPLFPLGQLFFTLNFVCFSTTVFITRFSKGFKYFLNIENFDWLCKDDHFQVTVFFVCLFVCRIVLEAGYFLQDRAFFNNLGTILLYAVVVSSFTCL